MDGQKANLVVTDPPYNVNYEGTAGNIQNDHMEDGKFYQFLFAAFINMEQSMETDASIYVFHADTEGLNFRKAFHDAGFYLSGCCIWKKSEPCAGRSPTSGSMSRYCSAGRRAGSTTGIRTGSRLPFGSLTVRSSPKIIRP